ncbi:diguanylate cyclase domain-containing protein [Paraburkholderia solisilvae]|uniref:Diguanylate cyclase DgcN n=1 Tax=Paraburkholderia solisilvae TaxID=624376 RepID=A0A6J5CXX9_9BURK|nr:diguanylate cyclase [Paraburkholderia solisilvae]CAB3746027.1 Diguanylate cyclase DgcN [Paraburkholderia solisilvae]
MKPRIVTRYAQAHPVVAPRPSLERVLRRTYMRLAVSAVALAAVCIVFVAWTVLRAYANDNLTLLARSIAYTVEAAVVFNDKPAAQDAIAQIAGNEDIADVRIIDTHGAIFANWQRTGDGPLSRWVHRVADLALPGGVSVPVTHDGKVLARIRVRGRGHQFAIFLIGGIGGVLVCLIIILGAGTLIARQMHRDIVEPLRALAEVAHAVRRDRAFSRRVEATPIAELHELGDDFNALLDEFEVWQHSLREQNATLSHQANHDRLTGLPNRAHFESRLEQALRDARALGTAVGLLYIDSDRFKEINDTLGHDAGDAVLVTIASRLRATLRKDDLVARLGGDEFVALLPGLDREENATRVAQALSESMLAPITLPGGREVTTSVSIGIALFPLHAHDVASLLRMADTAMYEAKRTGNRAWQIARENSNSQ